MSRILVSKVHLYGLIGKKLTHSFSPSYFLQKFNTLQLAQYTYQAFELDDITEFPNLLKNFPNLRGLNVTIPYKQQIIPFLDKLSPEAAQIGAVNTIVFQQNQLVGYNTDALGFEQSLIKHLKTKQLKALIFGTGGASLAIQYTLQKLKIDFQLVSTSKHHTLSYETISESVIKAHLLLINTTPLGTYPNIDTCINIPYQAITKHHLVIDLVYNPAESLFLKKAKQQGASTQNGYEMLVNQAELSWQLWNNHLL